MIRAEIKALTGIRGIAALAVLHHHFGEKLEVILPWLSNFSVIQKHGNLGVDLFFILSGFIMTYVYRQHVIPMKSRDYAGFIVKRFARIYPNHLVVLLLLLAMWGAAHVLGIKMEGNYSWQQYLAQVFLLSGYIPEGAWNYPNWSVSIEWFGYMAVFPLSLILTRIPIFRKYAWLTALAFLAAYLLIPLRDPLWLTKIWQISAEFLSGVFAFIAWEQRHQRPSRIPLADVVMCAYLALFSASFFTPVSDIWFHRLFVSSFPFLLYGLANATGLVSKFLSTRTMIYLGAISYALYISHALIEKGLKVVAPVEKCADLPLVARIAIVLIHFLLPIVFAALLYKFIEEPVRKSITSRFLPKLRDPSIP